MNRLLCEKNSTMVNSSTAYRFSLQLNDISIYALPLLAVIGNSITLLVILSNAQLNRSSFSVYVKSMAISDTFVLIFKLLSFHNKTNKYFYISSLCTILIFCGEASVLLSIWIIVSITIERTLVVLFPFHKNKFVSAYRARFIVTIIAISTIVFSARVLIIPIDTSVEQNKRCHPMPSWLTYRRVNKIITEFGYCYIPLTIVVIGNLLTICTVKRAVVRRHDILTNSSYQQKRQIDFSETQLMLMLFIVTLMFIVYFVPFTITEIISRWGLPFHICFTQKSLEIFFIIRALSDLLKDLNFCTNFIIYCVSGRRFRYALILLFKRLRRTSSLNSQNVDSNRNRSDYLLKKYFEHKPNHISIRHTMEESQF